MYHNIVLPDCKELCCIHKRVVVVKHLEFASVPENMVDVY